MKKPDISEMTLREKIGQIALVDQRTLMSYWQTVEDKETFFKEYPIGGLWVQAASNVGDMNTANGIREDFKEKDYALVYSKWIDSINQNLSIPLLTGADAECGCKWLFPECTQTSTIAGLAATDSPELAYETGVCVASEAKVGGVNWIWGPPVDLANPDHGTISAGRSFSVDNPDLNIRMAREVVAGYQSCKVAGTLKHFPSGGLTETRDSHVSSNVNTMSLEEWEKTQGRIYQELIDAGVWSIMTTHASFPAVDNRTMEIGGYIPATLSDKIIIDLLKKKMGFDGVVITDGIGMKSLVMSYSIDRLYVEIIKAGNDVILGVRDFDVYFNAVEEAVKSGEIPMERIDDACRRILEMKEKVGVFDDEKEKYTEVPKEFLNRTRELNKKVAQKSLVKVCDKNNQIPLSEDKIKKVVAVYLGHSDDTYETLNNVLSKAFEKHGASFKLQRYLDEETMHDEIESGEQIAKENDLILYLADLPNGSCNEFTGEVWRTAVFTLIHGAEKSIVMALRSPFVYYKYFTFAKTVLCTFGVSDEVLETAVDALYGDVNFDGKCPVELFPEFARDEQKTYL